MKNPLDLIFWDWNGTLLDDLDVCIGCLNTLLRDFGYPQQYDKEHYREIFTFPIQDYYIRAGFDFQKDPFPVLAEHYMKLYLPHAAACGLVPGARAALDAFRARQISQAVLSASPMENLRLQVGQQGVGDYFGELLGLGDIYAASKVELGVSYMRRTGIDPARALMLGDSVHDAEVARAMGISCILVAAGHQSRHVLESAGCPVVDRADQVPAMLCL